MIRWMDPLLAALERTSTEVSWFFRDDDAGWADRRFWATADVFERTGVVLDVAAIPAAVSPRLAARLRSRAAAGAVAVHQHGWAHVDHQPEGRRSEFGAARDPADQLEDLRNGRDVLAELLDGAVEPIFTPPWNRCGDHTAALLPEVGLTVMSCDHSAPRRNAPGVAEIPVRVDWARCWREGGPERLGAELAVALRGRSRPVRGPGRTVTAHRASFEDGRGCRSTHAAPSLGVMLHHATMTSEQLDALAKLLRTLSSHPSATLTSIGALAMAHRDMWQHASGPVGSGIGAGSS